MFTRFDHRARADEGHLASFLRKSYVFLLDQVPIRAWCRILTLECGDGWPAEEAWRRIGRGYVCGVDTSPTMVDVARERRTIEGQLEFLPWDGHILPFPDRSFDFVLSTFALHRFREPVRVLTEAWRVCEPGGSLYVLEPDRRSFGRRQAVIDYYLELTSPGHARYYTADQLSRLMGHAGFLDATEVARSEELSEGKVPAGAIVLQGRREPETYSQA